MTVDELELVYPDDPFVDSDGVEWWYQSLDEWQGGWPQLEPGQTRCWVCGRLAEYGVAGRRYCEACCP